MARHEADREDLIREATALNPRVEWRVPGESGVVFAGLKRTGAFSLYFDQDPVFQFDPEGRLRRAFVGGFLYRTEGTTLACIYRSRSADKSILLRHDLSNQELTAFQSRMRSRLESLDVQLRDEQVTLLRSVADGPLPNFRSFIAAAIRQSSQLAPAIKTIRSRIH